MGPKYPATSREGSKYEGSSTAVMKLNAAIGPTSATGSRSPDRGAPNGVGGCSQGANARTARPAPAAAGRDTGFGASLIASGSVATAISSSASI
jgi:hypothetical protein